MKHIKGMNDILPIDSGKWLKLEEIIQNWLCRYNYSNIRTPILEFTDVFSRAIGDETDIVNKEMYSFIDNMNGDRLTLRPEGTASIARAIIEHKLLQTSSNKNTGTKLKLWYIGQMFRHEKPQAGRYRQFHQCGVEAFGFDTVEIDCEMIIMIADLWNILGINVELEINCLGEASERADYLRALKSYFLANSDSLNHETLDRIEKNPLRVIDSKDPYIIELSKNAPKLINYLTDMSLLKYTAWKNLLDAVGIQYKENYCLVRGLDYYNSSVFEWINKDTGQAICGGGRYDSLIAKLGGHPAKAIGFAIGLERLINIWNISITKTLIYIIYDKASIVTALSIARALRRKYIVECSNCDTSIKTQFRHAINSGARLSITIENTMTKINDLETRQEFLVALNEIEAFVYNYQFKL